jgi:DNA-binding response OmpR family regulator
MADRNKVLIIEDDQNIVELVTIHLKDLGFRVDHEGSGEEALKRALRYDYDLIILDLMLPELDGMEICRQLRTKNIHTPILILTAKSEELDKVLGLELGADDYVTKPFSIRELIARVKAITRRVKSVREEEKKKSAKEILRVGELVIDTGKRKVALSDREIDLTVKEFDLLALFVRNPGRAYSRQQLLDTVWGYQFEGYNHTVNSHINRLRSKIEEDPSNPQYIKTVWGFGYRFADQGEFQK